MPTRCIIDNSKEKEYVCQSSFANNTFKVVKCKQCGLLYIDAEDKKLEKILHGYYQGEYQKKYHSKKEFFKTFREKISRFLTIYYSQADSQIEFLKKNSILPGQTILDLGCGFGTFIVWLEKKGYLANGIEPDNQRAEKAKKYLKKGKITIGEIETAKFSNANAVTMLHVLEHLQNPIETLKEIKRKNPSSKILIEVPNCETKEVLELSTKEPHIYHFTPETIKKTIEKAGWRIIDTELADDRTSFWQQLKWLFFRKNVYKKSKNKRAIRILAE